MDSRLTAKLSRIYYSPKGYWKRITVISKLAATAKVSEEVAQAWLKKVIWQIYLPAPQHVPRPKFDVPVPNEVHQADLLFLPHNCRPRGRKTYKYALTVVDVASRYKEAEPLTSKRCPREDLQEEPSRMAQATSGWSRAWVHGCCEPAVGQAQCFHQTWPRGHPQRPGDCQAVYLDTRSRWSPRFLLNSISTWGTQGGGGWVLQLLVFGYTQRMLAARCHVYGPSHCRSGRRWTVMCPLAHSTRGTKCCRQHTGCFVSLWGSQHPPYAGCSPGPL